MATLACYSTITFVFISVYTPIICSVYGSKPTHKNVCSLTKLFFVFNKNDGKKYDEFVKNAAFFQTVRHSNVNIDLFDFQDYNVWMKRHAFCRQIMLFHYIDAYHRLEIDVRQARKSFIKILKTFRSHNIHRPNESYRS